jgi:hypothetical protein
MATRTHRASRARHTGRGLAGGRTLELFPELDVTYVSDEFDATVRLAVEKAEQIRVEEGVTPAVSEPAPRQLTRGNVRVVQFKRVRHTRLNEA